MSEVLLAQDLVKSKREVVDVKNKLIDSQDLLQACLLDHKKTLEELVEVRSVLAWASEHLLCCNFDGRDKQWCVEGRFVHYSPTLYAALKSAWEARDK